MAHTTLSPLLATAAVAAAALLATGCAHAPSPAQGADREDVRPAERALVTGSRIPQRVDVRAGLPATTSPVRIYTRRDLDRTGSSTNTAAALSKLDPSF